MQKFSQAGKRAYLGGNSKNESRRQNLLVRSPLVVEARPDQKWRESEQQQQQKGGRGLGGEERNGLQSKPDRKEQNNAIKQPC